MTRRPRIHHSTSLPYKFFGRTDELALLDEALRGGPASLIALVGPGGQGKTAIMQHWLARVVDAPEPPDGVFLWSFYRGKDADLCLRELFAYAEGQDQAGEVSASWCVDHLLPLLRRERWALVLDGAEVAQYESGNWFGRFLHPELGRLLEELAAAPMPGVVVMTSRFPLPELERRRHAKMLSLGGLDADSACGLLESVGVHGARAELEEAGRACGSHAKAVELLGTLLARFAGGDVSAFRKMLTADKSPLAPVLGGEGPGVSGLADRQADSDEERKVARVLAAYQRELPAEQQDILALTTAFRDPPAEDRLAAYLCSAPVKKLLHEAWQRSYAPFENRAPGWLARQLDELVHMRLLERVSRTPGREGDQVLDAHPLVRRTFEHVLGASGRRESSLARAGFLRGRPDRRRPATLEDAREEVELFHAYCEAGLWDEADDALAALDSPRYRFLAPAFERDLLLRFFPDGDWRQRPRWPGFRRYRALAVCFEMLGDFDSALAAYRADDTPLRGDALIAMGRLEPLLADTRAAHPWQILWQAYRAHALALAGRTDDALACADALVPGDIYEWAHVFECLLRLGRLDHIDMRSFLYRPADAGGQRWSDLARQRMRLDYLRVREREDAAEEERVRAVAESYKTQYVDLARVTISPAILGMMSEPIARENLVFPVAEEGSFLKVAITDPVDYEILQKLQLILSRDIMAVLATRRQISAAIERHYRHAESEYVVNLAEEYGSLLEAYDQGGLPYERALSRLSFARWLLDQQKIEQAREVNAVALQLARQHGMKIIEVDGLVFEALASSSSSRGEVERMRQELGYLGPTRP